MFLINFGDRRIQPNESSMNGILEILIIATTVLIIILATAANSVCKNNIHYLEILPMAAGRAGIKYLVIVMLIKPRRF